MQETKETKENNIEPVVTIYQSSPYVLTIPKNVEKKIRYHLTRFNGREWSGYLFYDYEGSFKENNIHFTARDFVFLDLGDGATTMFKESPKVLSFAIDNDLLDCKEGLIHSHHNMAAFFSGTDNAAIKQEAMNVNHFLSLVVNNAGAYVARVTLRRRVKEHIHREATSESWYQTYEGEDVHIESHNEIPMDVDKEYSEIEVFPLTIEVEKDSDNAVSKWEDDIKEVMQAKRASSYNPNAPLPPSSVMPTTYRKDIPEIPSQKVSSPTLFQKHDMPTKQTEINFPKEEDDALAAEYASVMKTIHKLYTTEDINLLVLRVVACCPFLSKNKISATPQYAVQLPAFVKENFANRINYNSLIDALVESLIDNFVESIDDSKISKLDPSITLDVIQSVIAIDAQERLSKIPQNEFIEYISATFDAYII